MVGCDAQAKAVIKKNNKKLVLFFITNNV